MAYFNTLYILDYGYPIFLTSKWQRGQQSTADGSIDEATPPQRVTTVHVNKQNIKNVTS